MAPTASALIEVKHEARVMVLTLKRPGQGNRLTQAMADEIGAVLDSARDDPQTGACVLTGHGDVFCLGGDYQGAEPTVAGRTGYARSLIEMDRAMARLGKPLVAAVNGDAHAGGFGVVVGCDMAVMADDATMGLPEAAKGLFPFIALAIVRDALPKKVLFDLIYNARLMNAAEACDLHLVNEIVPRAAVLGRAIALADHASQYNARIVKLGRDLYYDSQGSNPEDAFAQSQDALLEALAEKDRSEGR
jgi:enoyl-CoA hydratase/carnithine racemase